MRMSGLLRRLSRRPATADENRSQTESSDPTATPATAGGEQPLHGGDDQPTQVLADTTDPITREWAIGPTGWSRPKAPETTAAPAATVPIAGQYPERRPDEAQAERSHARDLPAGVDPAELEHAPASARRGRMRRRLRYLRSVRELLLRDLGGLTYEIHRTASGSGEQSHGRLQQAKAERIAALDAEVRALETRLGDPHPDTTLREPGIGGTCPECGELHASDAHFCSRCGTPLDAKARARRDTPPAPEENRPASALWAGLRGRKPAEPEPAAAEPEPAADKPAAVTGEWLGTGDQPTTFDRAVQPETGAPAAEEKPAAEAKPVAADEPAAAPDGDPTPREGEAVTSVEGRREPQ
ncbi:MAG TPA: zinc ribbon domain-containing protein [Solirubrobacteraceae bacterium]|nr:zinc ribbon domain-containing protein [Solirubrobacteraceae bacterium]